MINSCIFSMIFPHFTSHSINCRSAGKLSPSCYEFWPVQCFSLTVRSLLNGLFCMNNLFTVSFEVLCYPFTLLVDGLSFRPCCKIYSAPYHSSSHSLNDIGFHKAQPSPILSVQRRLGNFTIGLSLETPQLLPTYIVFSQVSQFCQQLRLLKHFKRFFL